MFDFSQGDYAAAVAKLTAVLVEDPAQFDAQLGLGMAYYRHGDYAADFGFTFRRACCLLSRI